MARIDELVKAQNVYTINDKRTIITDRMGPWHEQNVVLTWEGDGDKKSISITPDEVEVLFANGLTENVYRGEDGKLYIGWCHADICTFRGAIVCGVLAPTTQKKMRPEIVAYAKKMGYVTDEMTPVEMSTGTKTLIFNQNGTYSVFFQWHSNIMETISKELLIQFTKNFFRDKNDVNIRSYGIVMDNLTEDEVFSRKNIDIFRSYDIQLLCLNPEIDKRLLLRAIMQRAFIYLPCNTLRKGMFEGEGSVKIPMNRQLSIEFNEFGNKKLNCGKVHYSCDYGKEKYTYRISVPYSEAIRELMVDTEKVLKLRYSKKVFVSFNGGAEEIYISCNGENVGIDVERSLIALDYAITILQVEKNFNSYQLHREIISLLETDSSGIFRHEYFSFLGELKRALPDKTDGLGEI